MLKPTKTVPHPDKEFNREIIIGISDPPIGKINKKPRNKDKIAIIVIQ